MKKKIMWALLAILVIIQFFGIAKNDGDIVTNDISKTFAMSEGVTTALKTSCYDCHSNRTVYPWYAKIQPVAWWLANHVTEGKGEINFSEFDTYSPARKFHKLEEIEEMIAADEMPLSSYTLIHKDAVLTAEQKSLLTNWSLAMRDTMKAHYPADSLVMKRRPQPAK